jgi:hypothetical protein
MMTQPVNTVNFTIGRLEELHKFIESDLVKKLEYFCDYDKQALLDAVYYLNDYSKLLNIMEKARRLSILSEDDEEDMPKFKMDHEGNLTRII